MGCYVGPERSRRATPPKESAEPDDVRYIDEPIRRVRGDVASRRRRWRWLAEGAADFRYVRDVSETVVVDVGRPGVRPALEQRVGADEAFRSVAPGVVVVVAVTGVADAVGVGVEWGGAERQTAGAEGVVLAGRPEVDDVGFEECL